MGWSPTESLFGDETDPNSGGGVMGTRMSIRAGGPGVGGTSSPGLQSWVTAAMNRSHRDPLAYYSPTLSANGNIGQQGIQDRNLMRSTAVQPPRDNFDWNAYAQKEVRMGQRSPDWMNAANGPPDMSGGVRPGAMPSLQAIAEEQARRNQMRQF